MAYLDYNGLQRFKANLDAQTNGLIAPVYDSTKTYDVGDYVIYNNDLYRCTTAITTAESWTAAHWTQVALADDVEKNNEVRKAYSNINSLTFAYGNVYNGSINSDTNRIHTVDLIRLPKGTKLVSSAGIDNFAVGTYNLDGTYKANGTWTQSITINSDCYGRIIIRKSTGNPTISESEFSDLIDTISIIYNDVDITQVAYNASETSDKLKSAQDFYCIIDVKSSDALSIENLFDKSAAGNTTTGYYDRTNAFVTNGSIRTSDYIPVIEGYTYQTNINGSGFELFYDKNKTFLGYVNVSANASFKPLYGSAYMRVMYTVSIADTFIAKCDKIYAFTSAFAGKNGVAFGTSLTYRAATTGGYLQYLPQMLGATIVNKGVGNSCIYNNGANPDLLATVKAYTGYASADFVILEGFVNDWYNNSAVLGTWKDTTETSVCGCVRSALTYILSQNESATVVLVLDPIGKSASGVDCSSLAEKSNLTQTEFYNEVEKVANSIGIPVIRVDKMSGMSENTPYFYIDNIHPNDEGALQTAKTIYSVMKNIPLKVADS